MPQQTRLTKKKRKKKNPRIECLTLGLIPGSTSKITLTQGPNKTSNAPIEKLHRKSEMKPYLNYLTLEDLYTFVLTQMSKLLKTPSKQNFKTILRRPYSETAKMLGSYLTLPLQLLPRWDFSSNDGAAYACPTRGTHRRDMAHGRVKTRHNHGVLCLYKLPVTVCSLVPTL